MDIAALSMGLSQMNLAQEVGTSVLKMAMDTGEEQFNDILKIADVNVQIMERSINPHVGANIDIKL